MPAAWRHLLAGEEARQALASHRGWDPGSLDLGRELAARLGCPLHAATVTRLLVDLNRSADNPEMWSEFSRGLPAEERRRLLAACWRPHREAVEAAVAEAVEAAATAGAGEAVLHLSVHSFTPLWQGRRREVDVGLLFDPARRPEAAWCRRLRSEIDRRLPRLAVRDNEPYLGVADGLTTHLRRRFAAPHYLGIELEVSQRLVAGAGWQALRRALAEAVAACVETGSATPAL